MKNRIAATLFLLLGGLFIITSLTACNNFLNADQVKDEILEAIEIANSSPVTFYVTADDDSGTVTPTQLRLKKKEKFDVLFKPANNYIFQKWEVLDKTTLEPIEGIIKFKDETALETSGIVLEARENLIIHPKCILQPAVISHTPASATEIQLAHTPIVINFNMPMDFDNLKNNIDISSLTSADSLNDYFKPVMSPDGCTLTLIPENPGFVNLIKANTMDVTVSLSDKICVEIEEQTISLAQDSNSNFSVRYKPVVEKVKPQKNAFFVTRTPVTLETAATLSDAAKMSAAFDPDSAPYSSNEQKQAFLVNTTTSKVYIYGSYFDEDSGIKTITVAENSDNPTTYMVGYDYGNAAKFYTENGVTKFCIEYAIQSDDGVVNLTTIVYDAASNPVEETLKIIKVSSASFLKHNSTTYNPVITNVSKSWFFRDDQDFYPITDMFKFGEFETEYLSQQKTIRVGVDRSSFYYPVKEWIYGQFYRTFNDLNAYCLYNGVQEPILMNKGSDDDGQFYLELDVNSLNGLEGTIIVVDELLNNSTTLDFKFPSAPDVVYYNTDGGLTAQSSEGYKYYLDTIYGLDESDVPTSFSWLSSANLSDGLKYKLIPCNETDNNKKNACIKLLGDIDSKFYTKPTSTTLPSGTTVQLDTTTPYFLSTGETGKTNIKINLASGSWQSFDSIFVDYYDEEHKSNPNYYKQYCFTPENESLIIIEDTKNLYSSKYYVDVYGIKNNKRTILPTSQTISKFTDSTHDNIPPTAYLKQPSIDYYTFNMSDVGSAPKSAYLLLKSGEKLPIITPGSTQFTNVQIPVRTIEELAKYDIEECNLNSKKAKIYYYYFELEDTEKNSCIARIQGNPVEENPGVVYIEKSGSSWKIQFKQDEKYIQITEFYKSDGHWYMRSSPIKTETFPYPTRSTTCSIVDGRFIKIITYNDYWGVEQYSKPQYFYTGDQNTGTFDYMLEYSNTEMLIASDAPVLVETVATNRSYEECKTWTINDWVPDGEVCRSYVNIQSKRYTVLPLSASNAGPAKYTIPLTEMDKDSAFNGYNCYVVLAHLANGKTLISEVKQR